MNTEHQPPTPGATTRKTERLPVERYVRRAERQAELDADAVAAYMALTPFDRALVRSAADYVMRAVISRISSEVGPAAVTLDANAMREAIKDAGRISLLAFDEREFEFTAAEGWTGPEIIKAGGIALRARHEVERFTAAAAQINDSKDGAR
jgi:hypothetical protein